MTGITLGLSQQQAGRWPVLIALYTFEGLGRAVFEGVNKAVFADFFSEQKEVWCPRLQFGTTPATVSCFAHIL